MPMNHYSRMAVIIPSKYLGRLKTANLPTPAVRHGMKSRERSVNSLFLELEGDLKVHLILRNGAVITHVTADITHFEP